MRPPRKLQSVAAGLVPMASGFLCGGMGLVPLLLVIPTNACCGPQGLGGAFFITTSGPVPPILFQALGGLGLFTGAVHITSMRLRLPLARYACSGSWFLALGALMFSSGMAILLWLIWRHPITAWLFIRIAGIEGMGLTAGLLLIGGVMVALGGRALRRKTCMACRIT